MSNTLFFKSCAQNADQVFLFSGIKCRYLFRILHVIRVLKNQIRLRLLTFSQTLIFEHRKLFFISLKIANYYLSPINKSAINNIFYNKSYFSPIILSNLFLFFETRRDIY